ncbi:hypothetical protein [Haloferax sulfurifontis]|uniref:Uncharacterized protein n=2 Tax=Haloferax sulfurifontis TaxID=255616 RepID=M0IL38_9EURY|nr:hypothetical protein [Haloferax sulfurifontis]ELZ96558.1 hypothetical protein C441_04299 [Haloferax sulfurifontis ATCC BAA-897]GGC72896.1 hypothetical protein GCM10007209_38570 [Haloferax sulfurifontis]
MEESHNGSNDSHPINADVVAEFAEMHNTTTAVVDAVLTAAQDDLSHYVAEIREDASQTVAEDESTLVVLDGGHLWNDVAKEIRNDIDADEHVLNSLSSILGGTHDRQFKSFGGRKLTGYGKQQAVNALSTADGVFIQKAEPEDSAGDVDVAWRIRHDLGYKQPFNYNAEAIATVTGDKGTLKITRTYCAIPDDMTDEDRDAIIVDSEARHVESDTLVDERRETWSMSKQLYETGGRRDQYDSALREWVYANHTGDFGAEYDLLDDALATCDECGAFPEHDAGVYVDQRPTNNFAPDRKDTLCNHCRANFLAEHTMLSQQEAEVYALKESGLSHSATADALDISKSQVGTVFARIFDKKLATAERTVELVKPLH